MAEVKKPKYTAAQELIFERTTVPEDGSPIRWPYPNKVAFVAADTEFAMSSVSEASRQGRTIVLVFPDGDEIVLTPSRPSDMADKPWEPDTTVVDWP